MESIIEVTQQLYIDLFQDNTSNLTLGISLLEESVANNKSNNSILYFADWTELSHRSIYDQEWLDTVYLDLTKRAVEFNLYKCAELLLTLFEYEKDSDAFLSLIDIAIENSSIECIDRLVNILDHPDREISLGITFFTRALMLGNTLVADHLIKTFDCNVDGLKVINELGEREDYSSILHTWDYGSVLIYIMISHISNELKLHLLKYAMSIGTNPHGHSPNATCFDHPICAASCISVDFLDYFLSLRIGQFHTGEDILFSAVGSKAPFEEKEKIFRRLFEVYDIDLNANIQGENVSIIENAVLSNGKDTLKTIQYLAEKGATFDPNRLMYLAHEKVRYELRDSIYLSFECSQDLYHQLLDEEKQLMEDEIERKKTGKSKVWVVFPVKEY
jgi:hypothetical protein